MKSDAPKSPDTARILIQTPGQPPSASRPRTGIRGGDQFSETASVGCSGYSDVSAINSYLAGSARKKPEYLRVQRRDGQDCGEINNQVEVVAEEFPDTELRSAFLTAFRTIAADFRARNRDFDATVLGDLTLEFLVELAFEFADFSAADAGNVDMVARAMTFVKVAVSAKMQQIELVNQAVALEQINRAIHGDTCDAGIKFLGALEDFACVQMAAGRLHYLQKYTALAGEPDSA